MFVIGDRFLNQQQMLFILELFNGNSSSFAEYRQGFLFGEGHKPRVSKSMVILSSRVDIHAHDDWGKAISQAIRMDTGNNP